MKAKKKKSSAPAAVDRALDASIEAEVLAWLRKPEKSRRDYSSAEGDSVLKDARKMAEGRDDLPRFDETPISDADFARLALLVAKLEDVDTDLAGAESDRRRLAREAEVTIAAVQDARVELVRFGPPAGVRADLLALPGGTANPARFLDDARRVARVARKTHQAFHNPRYVLTLIAALDDAIAVVAGVVDRLEDNVIAFGTATARQAALRRITSDTLAHVARWAVAAIGDDETTAPRYRLSRRKKKRAKAKTPPES